MSVIGKVIVLLRRVVRVGYQGHSLKVTLPYDMVQTFGIKRGQKVEIIATNEGIFIPLSEVSQPRVPNMPKSELVPSAPASVPQKKKVK